MPIIEIPPSKRIFNLRCDYCTSLEVLSVEADNMMDAHDLAKTAGWRLLNFVHLGNIGKWRVTCPKCLTKS